MHNLICCGNRSAMALLGIIALVGIAQPRNAPAAIIWGTPTNISGDTNVSATGTLKEAVNDGGTTTVVNGVSFTALATAGTAGPFNSPGGFFSLTTVSDTLQDFTGFGAASAPFSSLSTAYKSILGTGTFTGNQPITVTVNSLQVGHVYQFELWINDSRQAFAGGVKATDGAANVTLDKDTNDTGGGTGQFVIGTLTPTAATEAITIDGLGGGTFLNAMELREVPEPSTALAGLFLGFSLLARRRKPSDET